MSSVSDIYLDANTITTSTAIKGKSAEDMGMDDFMTLLVAQMTNQDMLNPQSDTEFIAQMAQFSSLKGMQTIQEYQLSSYATSYIGKNVSIANINQSTGQLETISGVVESVTFYDGAPKVIVNGTSYDLHTVMEVNTAEYTGGTLSDVAKYLGKYVSISYIGDDGSNQFVHGLVTDVSLMDGKPYVTVNGEAYAASGIKSVGDTPVSTGSADSTESEAEADVEPDADSDSETEGDLDTDPE